MSFDLQIAAETPGVSRAYLRRHLRAATRLLDTRVESFSLAVVGDATMAGLHERFLKIPGPTDVLTFELDHDESGRVTAGEVVVCIDQARRNCSTPSGLDKELLLYALHGLLHLSGFDDRTPRGFEAMHRTEDHILQSLGVGPVFRRNAASRRPAAKSPSARRSHYGVR